METQQGETEPRGKTNGCKRPQNGEEVALYYAIEDFTAGTDMQV